MIELIDEKRVRYQHIRNGKSAVTLCKYLKGNDVLIGIAVCNKRDMFNKKSGRALAMQRLVSGGGNLFLQGQVHPSLNTTHQIMEILLTCNHRAVKEAASFLLKKYTTN